MNTSDVTSTPNVSAGGFAKSAKTLKIVGKSAGNGKDDFAELSAQLKSDADPQNSKPNTGKFHFKVHANAKIGVDGKANDEASASADFIALLSQVEGKLTARIAADENETSDAPQEDEAAAGDETEAPAVKGQNGTTSLFAGAYLMRGWDADFLTPASQNPAPQARNAANDDLPAMDAKPSKTAAPTLHVAAKVPSPPEPMDEAVATEPMLPIKNFTKAADKIADNVSDTKAKVADVSAVDVKVPPRTAATSQVQQAVTAQAEVNAQAFNSEASGKFETAGKAGFAGPTKSDSAPAEPGDGGEVIAGAQASGLIGEIKVTQQHNGGGASNGSTGQDKEPKQKDQNLANAKVVDASLQIKAEAVASANHVATDAPSPVTQIVERILQELPAQNAAADTSQVAQASKVLTVRLHPEGLGNVLVKISNSGGSLKISLASEQQTTGDQLESDSAQLLQALQQVMPAFKSDSLSFSMQDQAAKDNSQNNANQSSANQNGAGGNANPGRSNGSEGQNDSGRQAPNAQTYGMPRRRSGETANSTDAGVGQRSGSIYL